MKILHTLLAAVLATGVSSVALAQQSDPAQGPNGASTDPAAGGQRSESGQTSGIGETGEGPAPDRATEAGGGLVLDTDNDGRISREEWAATRDRGYPDYDLDRDTVISSDEFTGLQSQAPAVGSAMPAPGATGQVGAGIAPAGPASFESLDANSDGVIDQDEWFSEDVFDRLDVNRDGYLDDNEFTMSR